MKKTVLVLVLAALTTAASAGAEMNVNVQIGVPVYAPPQRVVQRVGNSGSLPFLGAAPVFP